MVRNISASIMLAGALALLSPLPARAFGFTSAPQSWNAYEFRLTSAPEGLIAVLWRFGDGEISGDRAAYHRFQHPGQYTVSVEATTLDGTVLRSEAPVVISFFNPGNWLSWFLVGGIIATGTGCGFMAIRFRRQPS